LRQPAQARLAAIPLMFGLAVGLSGAPATNAAPRAVDAAGSVITAASCGRADVETAINAAQDGDTVRVPAGICVWTTGVTISGKGIHLQGASQGAVTLTHNAGSASLIDVDEDASHLIEISNLRFIEGTGNGDNHLQIESGGRPVLVHDNYFETNGKILRSIRWGSNKGVIWHNEFFSNKQDDQAIVFVNNALDSSWTTPDTMGMRDTTGESNVYVEDNLFRRIYLQALDPDSNSRVVIRYNTFDNSALASHGADTSEDGVRHWEIYNNTFVFTNFGDCSGAQTLPLNWFFYIRGGTGVIADNVWSDINSCAWSDKPELIMTIQNLRRNSGPYPCWTTYPAPRQIGQSHDGMTPTTDPVYIWGNTGGGNSTPGLSDYSPNECGPGAPSVTQFIQAGRDFIVNVPKPGYVKYYYPHPLRRGAVVADLRVTSALVATSTLTATLGWTPPANAITTTLRYSAAPINDANWPAAPLLTATLPATMNSYVAAVPYAGGTVYFALRTQDATGAFSSLSNTAFWPSWTTHLPLVRK
jgi:hypothetical protein